MNIALTIIPAITALVAVIVSPLLTIYITKKQLTASVNSKNRQEWINTVRDEIRDYLFSFIEIEGMWFDKLPKEKLTKPLNDLQIHKIKISLLLNPNEKDHLDLLAFLDDAYQNLSNETNTRKPRATIEKGILELSQKILKTEWERVKSLK